MALLKVFKKKKEEKPIEKPVKKEEVKIEKTGGVAPDVLISPHIAEKPTRLMDLNQYVFKVFPKANKVEIKKAIKEIYNVDVLKVRIINIPKKMRRKGRNIGWKKGYKKAIITVKKGQEIEILPH